MANGISLHIGINHVNPIQYSEWWERLNGAENDAEAMRSIAGTAGFDSTLLLADKATRDYVMFEIQNAAGRLQAGDTFLITYSGHGGQKIDLCGYEDDLMNETWCLYDGHLIDDELYLLWKRFEEGVNIVMFSDSCNSGTVAKLAALPLATTNKVKSIPGSIASKVAEDQKEFYDQIRATIREEKQDFTGNDENFSGLLIAACRDGRSAFDGPDNSLFTKALLEVWDDGRFQGGYWDFYQMISNRLYRQEPNYYRFGRGDYPFEHIRPFSI